MSVTSTIQLEEFLATDRPVCGDATELAHQILKAVKGLREGSVELRFAGGRLVEIERRERTALGSLGFRSAS